VQQHIGERYGIKMTQNQKIEIGRNNRKCVISSIKSLKESTAKSTFLIAVTSRANASLKLLEFDAGTQNITQTETEEISASNWKSDAVIDLDCFVRTELTNELSSKNAIDASDGTRFDDALRESLFCCLTTEEGVFFGTMSAGDEDENFRKKCETTATSKAEAVLSARFSEHEKNVVSMCTKKSVMFYDYELKAVVNEWTFQSECSRASKGDWSKQNENEFLFSRAGRVYLLDKRVNNSNSNNDDGNLSKSKVFEQKSFFRDCSFCSAGEDGKTIITASEDWLVKTWDLRKASNSATTTTTNVDKCQGLLKCFAGHENVVTKARFNPVYDSIALSSSLDGTVKLWRDSDLSRLPDDDDYQQTTTNNSNNTNNNDKNVDLSGNDVELKAYGNLQTTKIGSQVSPVIDACWSSNDPWVFAAVTIDGTFSIGVVPRSEKYRILL